MILRESIVLRLSRRDHGGQTELITVDLFDDTRAVQAKEIARERCGLCNLCSPSFIDIGAKDANQQIVGYGFKITSLSNNPALASKRCRLVIEGYVAS